MTQPLVSVIIPSYQRAHLLRWNLSSLARQPSDFGYEVIVLNDGLKDETFALCQQYSGQIAIRYIFTGHRNLTMPPTWRCPGFAINIGVKLAEGRFLVICCAEMYHVNETLALLAKPLLADELLLTVPHGYDDVTGNFLKYLETNKENADFRNFRGYLSLLNTRLPFTMGLSRRVFMEIGGYDEDFTGKAYEDNDLVDRLLAYGCRFCLTPAQVVHLYHPRFFSVCWPDEATSYNQRLYKERKGMIVRNRGREWGVLEQGGNEP